MTPLMGGTASDLRLGLEHDVYHTQCKVKEIRRRAGVPVLGGGAGAGSRTLGAEGLRGRPWSLGVHATAPHPPRALEPPSQFVGAGRCSENTCSV